VRCVTKGKKKVKIVKREAKQQGRNLVTDNAAASLTSNA